uniref:endogenous retrovirus group FC1 Env polyprotein-like isoform X2 n=1 Tax=Callithrix jacchus TaxID=9483 RepID=UPI0023DD65C7|nr:endogenous retrovirus group FC1 Env polyprotein-like isoform X2 [Callithrix jacchus]
MDPPYAGRLFLLALYLSNLPGPSSHTPYRWRFFLTENYTKTTFICNTPPYSHNHLLATSDCPAAGCQRAIYLNFTKFHNIHTDIPLMCFNHDQPSGACNNTPWRSCMGCTWMNCRLHIAVKSTVPARSQLKIIPDIDGEGTDISLQEKSLNDQLQPHSSPFSWLTFLQEGIKLANLSGLTDLTSCLMCAFLGQTPFVAVPYPIPLNLSASTSSFSPVREVDLYTPPDFEQLPVCYSLGRNFPSCNRTILVTTNITAPRGTFFWCNRTLTKTLYIGLSSSLLCLPVTLVPRLTIYSSAEFQMLQAPHRRTRRAAFLPIAVGVSLAGSALAAGLGGGALVHSHLAIARLTSQLQAAIDDSTESLASLQRQITSVAQVALQNRRALDLLTAEQGGTCIFLQEECCYYINESGLVETRIESLQKLKTSLQSQKFSAEATACSYSGAFKN